jgi:hypothetical protein
VTTEENGASRLQPAIAAELHALRERVQMQHALIDVYSRARSAHATASHVQAFDRIASLVAPTQGKRDRQVAPAVEPEASPLPQIDPAAEWWPIEEDQSVPLVANPGWSVYSLADGRPNAIGFAICGLPAEAIANSIDLVGSVQRQKRNFVPIFITDASELAPFRDQGFVVEYFPASRSAGISAERWAEYARKRRAFLIRKWNLSRIVDLGPMPFGGGDAEAIDQPELEPWETAAASGRGLSELRSPAATADGPAAAAPRPADQRRAGKRQRPLRS